MSGNHEKRSRLDEILENQGKEACQAEFDSMLRSNRNQAVAVLNQTPLSYPCFFVLLPQIRERKLLSYMSPGARTAAAITRQIQEPKTANGPNSLRIRQDNAQRTLRWMLFTGWQYDEDRTMRMILDVVASTLLNTYGDKEAMKTVCDMLVRRGVKGYNTHYLVWAYFHTHDAVSIQLLAEYLKSEREEERAFVTDLFASNSIGENIDTYDAYTTWLNENDPFLYFTDESLQYTGKPHVCKVDMERKYLNKKSNLYEKTPVVTEDEAEKQVLAAFRSCDKADRNLLCCHSQMLCKNNRAQWSDWIKSPLENQIQEARSCKGGKK